MHVAPRPGSDGYLAIAIAKEIRRLGFEDRNFVENHAVGYDAFCALLDSFDIEYLSRKCDIDVESIRRIAEVYGGTKPASIYLGYGINKWVQSPDMIRLIDALGALTGNIGVTGGGVNHGFLTRRHFDPEVLSPVKRKGGRVIPEPLLADGILQADPPVRMMWINGTNPVASCPDSNKVVAALKSVDFLVVVDHFMTDTADLADLFLPATTFLEEDDIVVSWGHNWIGPVNKAIEPLGEARSDLRIVQDLSRRTGLEEEMKGSAMEWLERALAPMEKTGISVRQVMKGPVPDPLAPMVAFGDRVFPTPSGNYEFIGRIESEPENSRSLHLLTVLSSRWLNSLILEDEHPELPQILIHPDTAKEKDIREKSSVWITSDAGSLLAEARITDETRADTVVMVQGTWIKRGGGVNRLTNTLMSTSGEMAAFYNTSVDIEPTDR
jgi:anaerobic selenocysteine-containing dehydrogenase